MNKGGDSHDSTQVTFLQKHYVTRLTADVLVFNIYTCIYQSIHIGSLTHVAHWGFDNL